MKFCRLSSIALVTATVLLGHASAFSMAPASPRVGVLTFMSEATDAPTTNTEKSKSQITHLQKKLRYWKQQQKKKETEYKNYQINYAIDHKMKPIYRREGKIDHYSTQPVFDQHTERIKTEIWSIKEQIKVTQAKLHEEWRVEKVQKKTADRLAHHDEEILSLKAQAQKEYEALMLKAKAEQEEYEMLMKKAREEQERISREAAMKLQRMQEESSERLTAKERQIAAVTRDIERLTTMLKENRDELQSKEICLDSLEKELVQKKAVLHQLSRERASIRALVKQSWRVLKDRFKKHILHKEEPTTDIEASTVPEIAKEATVTIVVNGETNGKAEPVNGKEKPSVVSA